MKIFDCFTYFNEEEVLKIRINEMGDIVDHIVIVEATKTFTGLDKPLYFDYVGNWINRWRHKIIRIVVDFSDDLESSWDREIFQRNQIVQGLEKAKDKDIIIVSDVDEITSRKVLSSIHKYNLPVQLDNDQFFWNVHWKVPKHCNQGARPVVARKFMFQTFTPQQLRALSLFRVPNAGWHFSYFSSFEDIVKKIESFAHTEYNIEEYKNLENIFYRIENGIDPFDRFPLKYYEIDNTYPKYIQKNYN